MTDKPNYCDRCGAKLSQLSNCCDSCGTQIESVAAGAPARKAKLAICPACGKTCMTAAEAIARYQSIPDKENPTEEEEDAEIERSETIDCLAKPEKPRSFNMFTWILCMLIPVVNVISVFCAPLIKGLKIFMIFPTLIFIGFVIWYAAGTFEDPFAARDKAYMVGFAWMMLYFACLLISKLAAKRKYGASVDEYEKALLRWGRLCYCESCNAVCSEDMPGKSIPAAKTRDYLRSTEML